MQQKYIMECESRIKSHAPIEMHGQVYEELLNKCDNVFALAIKKPYCDFVVIGSPIISRDTISSLVDLYITSIPTHFDTFFNLLGFKFKSNVTRNKHLTQNGYYKRQFFYNMLTMSRQKNKKKLNIGQWFQQEPIMVGNRRNCKSKGNLLGCIYYYTNISKNCSTIW